MQTLVKRPNGHNGMWRVQRMWKTERKSRGCPNVCRRSDLWHYAMRPAFVDDWILFFTACLAGGNGRYGIQPFQYGKPSPFVGYCDRGAFKEDGQ